MSTRKNQYLICVQKNAVTVACCLIFTSCINNSFLADSNSSKILQAVTKHTDIKEDYQNQKTVFHRQIKISSDMLNIKKIIRPFAPLRLGPGTQFPVDEHLMQWGDLVIEIETFKVWRKIFILSKQITGWVHHKILQTVVLSDLPKDFFISSLIFPVKYSRSRLTEIYSHPDKDPVKTDIPEKTPFLTIKSKDHYSLVILGQEGRVAWIRDQNLY